jgi:hypothetical protein
MRKPKTVEIEIGRSAITGRFIPVSQAEQHPRTTIVQHLTKPAKPPVKKGR